MPPIVVLGGNGQLGSDLVAVCAARGIACLPLTHADIDITDARGVDRALAGLHEPTVINTVSCHGTRADPITSPETYFLVNEVGAGNVAAWCRDHGGRLVHYSTDYVFGQEQDRSEPYREDDAPCPVNVYGRSKLAGERAATACPAHYVLRVASLYGRVGSRGKGGTNFVHTVLEQARRGEALRVTSDQTMCPTWSQSAAVATLDLLAAAVDFGLYHLAGSGACTWYEFAHEILRLAGVRGEVRHAPDPPVLGGSPVARPRYTALDNARLRGAGLADLPPWREALAEYLRQAGRGSAVPHPRREDGP